MRILLAPNSFKECANSVEAAGILSRLFRENFPEVSVTEFPVSDGGDGFRAVCEKTFGLTPFFFTLPACYPEGSAITVCSGFDSTTGTLYVESAEIFGLKMVPESRRNPMLTSSRGLGEMFKQIEGGEMFREISTIVLGLGGSATNDYGCGAAGVFGLEFYRSQNWIKADYPADLLNFSDLNLPAGRFPVPVKVVYDVAATITGPAGAAQVFAPQKGADKTMIDEFEDFANRLLESIRQKSGIDYSTDLIGAAGALTLGLHLFADVECMPARRFMLDQLGLREAVESHDVIVTGEGAFDEQSKMEKATGLVIEEAVRAKKKIILISGKRIPEAAGISENIKTVVLEDYFNSSASSIGNFQHGLEYAVKREIAPFLQLPANS